MGCYCWECGGARTVVEDAEHRARLDCGHIVCWDDGSGVWKSLSEPDLISQRTGVEFPG
jgi:hypothetical protein